MYAAKEAGQAVQLGKTATRYMPVQPTTGPAAYPPRDEAVAAFSRGEIQQRNGLYDAAVASYDEAIRIEPTYADAYRKRGQVYVLLGRSDWGVMDFDVATILSSKSSNAAP